MGKTEGFQNDYYSSWGTVALLFNPKRNNVDIMEKWSNFMAYSLAHHSLLSTRMNEKKLAINSKGLLTIYWPKEVNVEGKLEDIDFLIATVTTPKSNFGRYSTYKEIADAMIEADSYSYFRKNRKYGITTFQDNDILSKIKCYVKD